MTTKQSSKPKKLHRWCPTDTAFQSYILVQIPENYVVIAKDDIFYTVLEIVEGVKLNEFINFKRSRSDGYDRLALFSDLLLSLAIHGK